jgi:hypothetical protein
MFTINVNTYFYIPLFILPYNLGWLFMIMNFQLNHQGFNILVSTIEDQIM